MKSEIDDKKLSTSQKAVDKLKEVPERERPLSEQFRIVAKQWSDADAAASIMEEMKTTTLEKIKADIIGRSNDMADNAATRMAKCTEDWQNYLKEMCGNRARANKLRVQMEYLRMRHREWIGADANARAEMRLG